MKTSSRIALQFTLWIGLITGFILFVLNGIFLWWWVRNETQNLAQYMVLKDIQPRNPITSFLQYNEKIIALNPPNFNPDTYKTFLWIHSIRYIEWRRWMVGRDPRFFMVLDISQNINSQKVLWYMSLFVWVLVIILSYFLWRIFVRKSFRDLRQLAQNLDNRTIIDQSSNKINTLIASHLPKDDEINIIASSIESLEDRVRSHYIHLRHFVWHVSHELKTPLMIIKSDINLWQRTKEYEETLTNIDTNIDDMQKIVETLLMLTRLQAEDTIKKEPIDILSIVHDKIVTLEKKYKNKDIKYSIVWKNDISIRANEHLLKIALLNILDNAWKYSNEWNEIIVTLSPTRITVKNPWLLTMETKEKMRDPFWQEDKNRKDGIGMWLSLVQQIVSLHSWTITYENKDWYVICEIDFGTDSEKI